WRSIPALRRRATTLAERPRCAPWLPQAQTNSFASRAAATIAASLPRPTGSGADFISSGSVARQANRVVTIRPPKPQRSAYTRARVQEGSSCTSSAVLGLSIRKLATGAAAFQRRQRSVRQRRQRLKRAPASLVAIIREIVCSAHERAEGLPRL